MNAILTTNQSDALTREEQDYFKAAGRIIKQNSKEPKHQKSQNTKKIVIFILITIFLIVCVFCTIFAIINISNEKILSNISVMNIDISELTVSEANEKIKNALEERLTTDIILKHNEETYTFTPKQIQFNYDIDKIVNDAYGIGRNGNILQNNFEIFKQYFEKQSLVPSVSYNESQFEEIEQKLNGSFQDGVKQPTYTKDGDEVIIVPGKDGNKVIVDDLKEKVVNKLLLENYNTDPIDIPVVLGKCDSINIDDLHNTIYKEPVNATFSTNPYKITASEEGLDFDISIEEAKAMIAEQKDEYVIPLKVLYPSVTTDDIGIEAFPDQLASYSTSFYSSGYNKSNNVRLATYKIDGTVLMPGETFSYNETVGRRTRAAGFVEAPAYANGEVVSEVGGGICQVSSTLYNAVLRANLEVVDRSNHMFEVSYCPIGTDATVSWGAPDFQFKNNRNYAIKIVASPEGGELNIQIYGLRQDDDYEVEIESYRTGSISYGTTYTHDPSLAPGETKVIQSGASGATSVTYKILKRNGEEVDKVLVSRDYYDPENEIIATN